MEAVQFGGSTIRVMEVARLAGDQALASLGPDILGPDFDPAAAIGAFRASPDRELGDTLLDQRLISGIGNVFKSEACFAARANPWRPIADLSDGELLASLGAARLLMQESATKGRSSPAVYRRAGRPCPVCGTAIAARGQGDTNRRTYWCPRCQAGVSRAK